MSDDTIAALARILRDHKGTYGPFVDAECACGNTFPMPTEHREHVAEMVDAEFLVIPRTDIEHWEYMVEVGDSELVDRQFEHYTERAIAMERAYRAPENGARAYERPIPMWTLIPPPENNGV
jgi:hypothetical protein